MQQFPRHLHKFGGVFTVVENEAQQAAKLAEGWSMTPVLTAPEPPTEPAPALVLDEPGADLPVVPKKKGRK